MCVCVAAELCCTFFQFHFCFVEYPPSPPLIRIISQSRNNVPVAVACYLVACILHNPELTELSPGYDPLECVRHAAWQGEGLPQLPINALAKGWTSVLAFLRVRGVCARARRMLRYEWPTNPAAASLTTVAGSSRHVP